MNIHYSFNNPDLVAFPHSRDCNDSTTISGLVFMNEQWKPVNGYESFYEVSTHGRVKSVRRRVPRSNGGETTVREKIFNGYVANTGYRVVNLSRNNSINQCCIHRLVAEHFIPNPENKKTVNHKDGNKLNNHVGNLEWCTYLENNVHAHDTGLNGRSRPVNQLTLSGEFVQTFKSGALAARVLKINHSHICSCLTGKRNQAGGFKWERA